LPSVRSKRHIRQVARQWPRYRATCVAGVEHLVAAELRRSVIPGFVTGTHKGERHASVLFRSPLAVDRLLSVRIIDNLFVVVAQLDNIGSGTGAVEAVCAELPRLLPEALEHLQPPLAEGQPRFIITASVPDRRRYGRGEVERAVRATAEALGWRHDPDNYEAHLHISFEKNRAELDVQLPHGRLWKRDYKVATLPGSLEPTVANLMATLLSKATEGGVFVDLMCGAGTIAIERALSRGGTVIAGDISAQALEAAAANAQAAGVPVRLVRWDATALPLAKQSVHRVACNFPYGKDIPLGQDSVRMLKGALGEVDRVLKPNGLAVVLWVGERQLNAALDAVPRLKIDHSAPVVLGGQTPALYVLKRP
jgi:tRNA (guanine6-N2)-methyltransferase